MGDNMVGSIYKNNFNPNSIAIKYKGNCITYNELDTAVNQYASLLSKLGVKADDRVLLSCPNSPEFIYSYLSVVKNGAVIVPMNLQLTMTEIRYLLDDSGAKFMLIHPAILKAMNQSQGSLEELLNLQVIVLDEVFKQDLLETPLVEVETISDENAVSTFLYTSGTTGKPKAAMLTHKNLVTNAEQCRVAFSTTAEDNFMCVLPMFHVFGFTVSVLNPFWTGATVTILEKFHPKEVVESFIQDEVTVFAGVPTMYVVLLEACKNSVLFPKLRLAISGGAAMPVEVLRQAKDILKLPVVEGYGLT